jgi:hypothetical protein
MDRLFRHSAIYAPRQHIMQQPGRTMSSRCSDSNEMLGKLYVVQQADRLQATQGLRYDPRLVTPFTQLAS